MKGEKKGTALNLVSCLKASNYILKGCHAILAHVKEIKSDEKRIEDVPIVREFPEVFPDDLPGLPLLRPVESTLI